MANGPAREDTEGVSLMDPARLAEIEATYPIDLPVPGYSNGPIGPAVVIHELIAEVRTAWRERDDERQIRDQWEKTAYSFRDRADRAEAEVTEWKIKWGLTEERARVAEAERKINQDTSAKSAAIIGRYVAQLEVVCKAAEAIMHEGWEDDGEEREKRYANLRRALSAAQDPAR